AAHDTSLPGEHHHAIAPEPHVRFGTYGVQRRGECALDELRVRPTVGHARLYQRFGLLAAPEHDRLDHGEAHRDELQAGGAKNHLVALQGYSVRRMHPRPSLQPKRDNSSPLKSLVFEAVTSATLDGPWGLGTACIAFMTG